MSELIKYIALILNFILAYDVLASDGYCENCKEEREKTVIDTIGRKRITNTKPCLGESISYDMVIDKQITTFKICKNEYGYYSIDTIEYAAVILSTKFIETDSTSETIKIESDSIGNVKKFRHKIWKENSLVLAIYDSDTLKIIVSNDPCVFTIIESSGDSVFINLDPKKEYSDFANNKSALTPPNLSIKHKNFIDTSTIYSDIIFDKYIACKYYHNKEP